MLRVSYTDTAAGQRWSLSGCLAGPWVEELRTFWQYSRERAPRAKAVVELKDVTFVDEAGERLLEEMQEAGTEFVAAGVYNKHLIATLNNEKGHSLRRRLEYLRLCGGGPANTKGGEK